MRGVQRLPAVWLALALWLAACDALPGPTASPSRPADGLAAYDAGDFTFAHPAAWGSATYDVMSSFSTVVVYLSTAELSDPCERALGMTNCMREAVGGLGPSGLLVEWTHWGFPGWTFDPTAGTGATIGGRAATVADLPADERCRKVDGEAIVSATIPMQVESNWVEMRACLRGPGLDRLRAQVAAMLDSFRWVEP